MSHNLDDTTGQPALAYTGKRTYHGLGEHLDKEQPIEAWLKAARLEWLINMVPVQYLVDGALRAVPDKFVLSRSDSGDPLSIVSGDYLVVQPSEVLEFYRELVDMRHYQLETAGALDGGRKIWALARTGLVANVAGDPSDQLGAYVLLATSCDKSLATTITFTSIRVVCENFLNMALDASGRDSIKIEHTRKFDGDKVKMEMGLVEQSWERFKNKLAPFAEQKLNELEASEFFRDVVLSDKEKHEGKITRAKQLEINQLGALYRVAPGQELATSKGTLWGALNAVTYYVDHSRRALRGRLESAWFGPGAALKKRARALAEEMVSKDIR